LKQSRPERSFDWRQAGALRVLESDVCMEVIVRDSKLPFYHQLYQILRQNIIRGEWQPGDMLPPESELIERYQVSRITVRQALETLVNDGLIYRQQGRGTFVAHPTVEQSLLRIISFTEDMRQRGFEPGTEVLFSGLAPAPPEIAQKLEVRADEELVRLERLRLADKEPMSIEESYLVHRYCPGILQKDYATSPLREALERDYGIQLIRAKQLIRATEASSRIAHLLSISSGAALLLIERISYSHQNIPVEFLRIYYRADRYVLHSELQG
jgi:GntR family transcriptional regulator